MVVGIGILTCGVVATFQNVDGVAAAALLITGFAVTFVGFYAGYISSFKFGQLEAVIAQGMHQIQAETAGAIAVVQETAQTATDALRQVASDFKNVREGMARGGARDDTESKVLEEVMVRALEQPPSIADIGGLARSAELNDRIVALGALRVNPQLWDFESVLYAIEHFKGGFDLDRFLGLAADMIHRMDAQERNRLRHAVETLRSEGKIRSTQIRWLTSERLIRLMGR